jgi:hypothetical protein
MKVFFQKGPRSEWEWIDASYELIGGCRSVRIDFGKHRLRLDGQDGDIASLVVDLVRVLETCAKEDEKAAVRFGMLKAFFKNIEHGLDDSGE